MAAVRLLLAKGAYRYNISTKNCNTCLNIVAIFGLSKSSESLSGYVQNINKANIINERLSLEVTDVSSRECYPTVKTVTCADQTFAEVNHEVGVDEDTSPTYTGPLTNSIVSRNGLQSARWQLFLPNPEMHTFPHHKHSLSGRHLLGREHYVPVRAYSGDGSRSEPLFKSKTGYYDVLQVSPNATRAQIKTAYYKQSFIYHPDKNAGSEEATIRFSDISEAYNVLGNKGLKKKYDRGLLTPSDLVGATKPSARETTTPTKQQTRASHSVMGSGGKKIFDFDAYIKDHYGEQLQRDRELRERNNERLKMKEANVSGWKLDKTMEVAVGLLVATALAILFSVKNGGH